MSRIERRTVAACVDGVLAAYHDGHRIIHRLREHSRALSQPLNAPAAERLGASLELGPAVIQGQYDHDYHRFGDAYARGDSIAREQLKDVLITLQMEVMSALSRTDDSDALLNYDELQQVSDECRVNAIVCLGQLYQRLAHTKNTEFLPMQGTLAGGQYRPWAESDSSWKEGDQRLGADQRAHDMPLSPPPSTGSSPSLNGPYSPDIISFHLSELEISPSPCHRGIAAPQSPETLPRRRDASRMSDEARKRRTASSFGAIPSLVDYPTPSGYSASSSDYTIQENRSLFSKRSAMQPPPRHPNREAGQRQMEMMQAEASMGWTQAATSTSRIYDNSNDFGHAGGSRDEAQLASNIRSYSSRNQHPPRTQSRQNHENMASSSSLQSPSTNYPVKHPSQIYDGIQWVSDTVNVNQIPDIPPPQTPSSALSRISTTRSQFLTFPSEANNYGGFCQGAWRLQIGDLKKSFAINQRPVGMTSTLPFWRCRKCEFEGPVAGGTSKASQTFDRRVRRSPGGIQYRWVFLAKCHIQNKKVAPIKITDGTFGTFGCIFCCAEGTLVTDNMSIHSGSSSGVQVKANKKSKNKGGEGGNGVTTPFFGNVQAFMEHLEEHRVEGRQPSSALLERAKCIVGRVASVDEEFDINLPPLRAHELA